MKACQLIGLRIEPHHRIEIIVDLRAFGHGAGTYHSGNSAITRGHGEVLGGIALLGLNETSRVQVEYSLIPFENSNPCIVDNSSCGRAVAE